MDSVLLCEGNEKSLFFFFFFLFFCLKKHMYSRVTYFFFILFYYFMWCLDHKASQLTSGAWSFLSVFIYFSVPDRSTPAVPLETIILRWSFVIHYVIPRVLCLFQFHGFQTSIALFQQWYNIRTYLLLNYIEAHPECFLIRFPDPVLYTEKTEYHIFLGLIQMDKWWSKGRDLPHLQKTVIKSY